MNRRTGAAGFTLVEVLVALTVMAVLAALAWRGVDAMLGARAGTEASLARTARIDTVMTQLRQDLESFVDPGTARATPTAWDFDGRSMRLVRADGDALRIVVWAVHGGVWMRWSSPPASRLGELQEQWLRSQQLLGNEPEQVRLLEVDGWTIVPRAADGTRYNAGSTATERVPRALEIGINLGPLKIERLLLTATVG